MSPDKPTTERRVILLPAPVWALWLLGLAARRVVTFLARHAARGWSHRQSSRSCQVASQHKDSQSRLVAERLFIHLNAYRTDEGLPTLRWSRRLEASSLYQSTRMSELGEFAHVLSDGVELTDRVRRFGYRYQSCGENLFWLLDRSKGVGALAWTMHDGWVHSPGHQANLVGDWVEVGIGVVPDGEGGYYATQNFGRPM